MNDLAEDALIADRITSEHEALIAHRARGGKVMGYTCHGFPPAIAAGLGLWPVRVVCGAEAHAETGGERIVRPDVCPQVKSLIGNVLNKRGLHGQIDMWAGLQTCDQMRRGMHILAETCGAEVHPIHLPATRTPEAEDYYVLQVRRMVKDIEASHGMRFNPALALSWQIERVNAARVIAHSARTFTLSPITLHRMLHLFFVSRPEGLAKILGEIIDTAKVAPSGHRVVLAGGPVLYEDTALLEMLDAYGIKVLPVNCTGLDAIEGIENPMPGDDPIDSLARGAFRSSVCMRMRPNAPVFERISEAIDASNASGLIIKSLRYCDHWYTERVRLKERFQRVPVLVFDSDYAQGAKERALTRVEAFLEMLG